MSDKKINSAYWTWRYIRLFAILLATIGMTQVAYRVLERMPGIEEYVTEQVGTGILDRIGFRFTPKFFGHVWPMIQGHIPFFVMGILGLVLLFAANRGIERSRDK